MKKILNVLFFSYTTFVTAIAQHNPVLNQNFPDPTVILAPDGNYYAYATNSMYN